MNLKKRYFDQNTVLENQIMSTQIEAKKDRFYSEKVKDQFMECEKSPTGHCVWQYDDLHVPCSQCEYDKVKVTVVTLTVKLQKKEEDLA